MASTLAILAVIMASLGLTWTLLRSVPEIRSIDDWEAKKSDVDLKVFEILIDPAEEQFLKASLSRRQFYHFQRRRLTLALRLLRLVGRNAALLIRIGRLAKSGTTASVAREAEELIVAALQLRCKLLLIEPWLWMMWVFPGRVLWMPKIQFRYEELLDCFSHIRTQRQGGTPAFI